MQVKLRFCLVGTIDWVFRKRVFFINAKQAAKSQLIFWVLVNFFRMVYAVVIDISPFICWELPMILSPAAPVSFERRIHKALKFWCDSHPQKGLLDDLLIAHRLAPSLTLTRRQRTNVVLEQGLARLSTEYPVDATLLEMRFCQHLPIDETKRNLHYAESTIYSKQNHAIMRLAAILQGMEITARHERSAQLAERLDLPLVQPIGLDEQIAQLVKLLTAPRGPWIVAIEGVGGIGKTTLAGAVVHQLAAAAVYGDFGWVSAQLASLDLCGEIHPRSKPAVTAEALVAALAQSLLPPERLPDLESHERRLAALRQQLKKTPHVIVVDNFETVLDPQTLLPILNTLANPSKFILTSRRRLIAEVGLHFHCVPELSQSHSIMLLRQAAHEHSLAQIMTCQEEELLPIYAAVGGNPLALLVVLGQTHVRPLHAVLADLVCTPTQSTPALFDYIYWQAWEALGEQDRQVLLAVAAGPASGSIASDLAAACALDQTQLMSTLQRLIRANLLYPVSDLDTCCYCAHSLTRLFLRASLSEAAGERIAAS